MEQASRLLPELDKLADQIDQSPDQVLARAFPDTDAGLRPRAIVVDPAAPPVAADDLDKAMQQHRAKMLRAGRRALEKIRKDGPSAQLDPEEADGLEAIVMPVARPALLIRDGRFAKPLPPWQELEGFRNSIERVARSVGRIELSGSPRLHWGGTGWLIGEDTIVTNRHVAELFSGRGRGAKWSFIPGMAAGINYGEDPDSVPTAPIKITGIIGVHERFDLALFKIARMSGAKAPEPLTVASQAADTMKGRKVYVLGYPAHDSRNGETAMRAIFADIYNVKRLQPGKIMEVMDQDSFFHHDASTLGGNSGSCVVDLETGQVIGLHFSGVYLKFNRAIALWMLKDDPLLKAAKANFD
jgi:hypothetical protein